MPATAPRPRSPAQIEAARRNGARSRGPVTAEGKARASRNALKHGLTALEHLVLDGEDAGELAALTARLMAELGPESEIEARLARQLAIAFWKGERAERIEVAILASAPTTRMNGYQQVPADPLTTFDVRRFNAIRGQQAQLGREIKSCLKELRQLRKDALETCTGEPEVASRNEPDLPPTANDDAPVPRYPGGFALDAAPRNEPGEPPPAADDDEAQPHHAGADASRDEPDGAGIEATRAALLVWAQSRERRLQLEEAGALATPLERPAAAIDQLT